MPALQKKHKKSSVHNIKSVMNTRYGTNVLIGVISKSLFYNGLRMVTSSIYLLSITLNYEK